jgi:hypothetical protein
MQRYLGIRAGSNPGNRWEIETVGIEHQEVTRSIEERRPKANAQSCNMLKLQNI